MKGAHFCFSPSVVAQLHVRHFQSNLSQVRQFDASTYCLYFDLYGSWTAPSITGGLNSLDE